MRAPRNKSLAWSILGAGSMLVMGYHAFTFLGVGNLSNLASSIIPVALQLTGGTMILFAVHNYISSLPQRRFKVACENTGLYIERDSGLRLPVLRGKECHKWGWRLWYKLPIGLALRQFEERADRFEAALDAEVVFAYQKNLLRVDILPGTIPSLVEFALPEDDLRGNLPFVVGVGREGLIHADLTECPHLLVAGQTGAGKSNFLHGLVACLSRSNAVLHIIDLKRVEFSYLKKHINVKYTLQGAVETLEFLSLEMKRRMALLDRAGVASAKEWRKKYPDGKDDMPYHVLVVDEFSQLCPGLSKIKSEREIRNKAHRLLVDIICLARSLGIHVVIATQRPDAEILPGQLKANIPATICFAVRSEVNSRICLENDLAAKLPEPKELPGRAIWQHDVQRHVQTAYLPLPKARLLFDFDNDEFELPFGFSKSRLVGENDFNVGEDACTIAGVIDLGCNQTSSEIAEELQ